MVTLVNTPLAARPRSITEAVLKVAVALIADTVGAGGVATTIDTVAGVDEPPGPVPTNVKRSVPKYPGVGV